jgi:membrane-associated protease RseP (regulator of RpoE activity)
MSVNRSSLSRPIVWLVFTGVALAGVTTFWGQNPAPQTARQPGAAAQPQQPQNANPNAAATTQQSSAAQAAGQQARQADRQASRTDRANSADSRQRRTDEQEDAAWLGVFLNQRDNERGATIAQVYPSGPAARSGLQSGDVIQQINGQQIASGNDLVGTLEQLHPGDKAELSVLRNNEPSKLTVTLGSRNAFGYGGGQQERLGGRGGQFAGQFDEGEDSYNIPLHAMELEHNRRNAEQHQRIENEIAQLREEIRQLRETLQRR